MKIAVVGLGMAGLRTAMLLRQAGFEVEIYEAKGRPGGRLHCVDEGDGVLYEAGAEWLDADHRRCIELLKEFSLEKDVRAQWPRKLIFRGREISEDLVWNEALEDDLRVEASARELSRNLHTPPWANVQCGEMDHRRLNDFLREHTQTERGFWWVNSKARCSEGDDTDQVSLLGWLLGFVHTLDRDGDQTTAFRIPSGSRRLCEQMLAKIDLEPHYGHVLQRVRQNGNRLTLHFDKGTAEVDRVVLAMPAPCVERVVFEPALSVQKRCAIEACEMSRSVKVCWQFTHAWWRDQGWDGGMLCDGPLQQTWDGTMGETPVLVASICGHESLEWARLGDPVRAALYELSVLFPEASGAFVRGWFHDWARDPFSPGAHSRKSPGYILEHMAHIAPPEGLIHFAGEHTGTRSGLVEGALESAERVLQEVTELG